MTDGEPPRDIDTLLLEERRYPPPPGFTSRANATEDLYDKSFDELWDSEARSPLRPPTPAAPITCR